MSFRFLQLNEESSRDQGYIGVETSRVSGLSRRRHSVASLVLVPLYQCGDNFSPTMETVRCLHSSSSTPEANTTCAREHAGGASGHSTSAEVHDVGDTKPEDTHVDYSQNN